MQYEGYIFPILFWDRDHVLLESEYRKEIAHTLNWDGKNWTCSCENSTIEKNEVCKHVKYLDWVSDTLKRIIYEDEHRNDNGSRAAVSPPEPDKQ